MTLGQKLKQTRLARGMTQSQVVGDRITRNMLSQIENDLASPSVGTLEYLASVLNVRLSWLLADEQEEAEAGRTQRLRELLKSGEYAACLELAPEHAPDDEQALALAMAAAQCAQRALESERFDTARHLAQRGLAWNNGSLYASAALMLHLWDILARCAQSAGPGQEEAAFADYRQAYAAQPVRARYHLAMARYQLERGKTGGIPRFAGTPRVGLRPVRGGYDRAAAGRTDRPAAKAARTGAAAGDGACRPRTPGLQNGLRMRRPPAQAVMRGSTFSCAFLAAVVY